jgi:hypothetical protein
MGLIMHSIFLYQIFLLLRQYVEEFLNNLLSRKNDIIAFYFEINKLFTCALFILCADRSILAGKPNKPGVSSSFKPSQIFL